MYLRPISRKMRPIVCFDTFFAFAISALLYPSRASSNTCRWSAVKYDKNSYVSTAYRWSIGSNVSVSVDRGKAFKIAFLQHVYA